MREGKGREKGRARRKERRSRPLGELCHFRSHDFNDSGEHIIVSVNSHAAVEYKLVLVNKHVHYISEYLVVYCLLYHPPKLCMATAAHFKQYVRSCTCAL